MKMSRTGAHKNLIHDLYCGDNNKNSRSNCLPFYGQSGLQLLNAILESCGPCNVGRNWSHSFVADLRFSKVGHWWQILTCIRQCRKEASSWWWFMRCSLNYTLQLLCLLQTGPISICCTDPECETALTTSSGLNLGGQVLRSRLFGLTASVGVNSHWRNSRITVNWSRQIIGNHALGLEFHNNVKASRTETIQHLTVKSSYTRLFIRWVGINIIA